MILDKQALFSDAQNLAQSTGTYYSTNSYDLGVGGTMPAHFGTAYHDPGTGNSPNVFIRVTEAFTGGTVTFNVVMSANADLSSPTILASTPALTSATLVAGYEVRVPCEIPHGTTARYFGVQYVVGGSATTTGKVTAGVTYDNTDDNYKGI